MPVFAATVVHAPTRDVKPGGIPHCRTFAEENAESSRTARSSQGVGKHVPPPHHGGDSPRSLRQSSQALARALGSAPETGRPVLADDTSLARWPDNAGSPAAGASGGQLPDRLRCNSGSGDAAAGSTVRSLSADKYDAPDAKSRLARWAFFRDAEMGPREVLAPRRSSLVAKR